VNPSPRRLFMSAARSMSVQDQQEKPLKLSIAIAAGVVVLSLAPQAAVAGPAEYHRGYHDCLAGRYDEDNDSRSYRQGCRDAQEEHGGDERPRYWRPDRGPPGPPPGPLPFPRGGLRDLRGMDPVRALQVLASLGYRNVGTLAGGGAIAGIYFNPQTRECVQVTNVNGRIADARPSEDPRCR
jgi:hypothetical protein